MLKGLFETPAYMQNRELSWLKFNERVLHESERTEMPLLERLKFISIFFSNLDEFFMIRVGSLSDSVILGNMLSDNKTGMTAAEQLREIYRAIAPLYALAGNSYSYVIEGLKNHGVHLLKMHELKGSDLKTIESHFVLNILPLLSPSIIDQKHPFPHITNKSLQVAVSLKKKSGAKTFGLIAVPSELDRLVFLDSTNCRFVLLEDLIMHFADLVFDTYIVTEKNIFAVTRNADIGTEEELLDEDIDFRQHMKALLKKRQRLAPVRLELSERTGEELESYLCQRLHLNTSQVFYSGAPLDLSFAMNLSRYIDKKAATRLLWPLHVPAAAIPQSTMSNMLDIIAGKDFLLSFPYESISPFLALVRQASDDPTVISIKITMYRIDAQSSIAESLIHAAENGKEVVVMMELRARFDESNNIEWASRLEDAGCRVIYGLVGYKCHAKLCLITRRVGNSIVYITQVGTGNYNEKTAKLYTDLSLMTSNQDIGNDASSFFNNMLIGNLDGQYRHLLVAPNMFKTEILSLIEHEREKALNGLGGRIIIKCNSLTDKEIIEKLVHAGADGVDISMNVRGICCLVPGLTGVTDNIDIISIVGKFLEHTRIFCFGKGTGAKVYISSADLMTRNTQRRVEVACPILNQDIKNRIIQMLEIMLADDTNAWELQSDGTYSLRRTENKSEPKSSQEIFTNMAKRNAANQLLDSKKIDSTIGNEKRGVIAKLTRKLFK